ncbi:MAG: hypothetical protein ACKPKO_46875, partial [Candidatus Fonsibacter sp.]
MDHGLASVIKETTDAHNIARGRVPRIVFDPSERVRPLGYWSFVTAGAPVIGVVAGVPLVALFGWRTIFLMQAP